MPLELIAPLTVIKKQEDYSELAAFLRPDQYSIESNGTDADLLTLHRALSERQQLLLSVWLSVYAYDYKDTIIG